ncbi:hypothetical protein BpHYR1_013789 [Brachionus plicatilis]|uniref:Uncharacterized protein n=1 Tax=Brachionus plicatilis TaxID=10195 RepID=A0A3M7S830_BRAPC|nr:hypothetical protein BpHYR1_013789 [Brachionus plicatilis]
MPLRTSVKNLKWSKREAVLKALEALRNTEEEVDDTNQLVIDSIESTINRSSVDIEQNCAANPLKSGQAKNWSWLDKVKEWRRSLRKKINFNEKPGPTSYATRNIDSTKLSVLMMNSDMSMLNLINRGAFKFFKINFCTLVVLMSPISLIIGMYPRIHKICILGYKKNILNLRNCVGQKWRMVGLLVITRNPLFKSALINHNKL